MSLKCGDGFKILREVDEHRWLVSAVEDSSTTGTISKNRYVKLFKRSPIFKLIADFDKSEFLATDVGAPYKSLAATQMSNFTQHDHVKVMRQSNIHNDVWWCWSMTTNRSGYIPNKYLTPVATLPVCTIRIRV